MPQTLPAGRHVSMLFGPFLSNIFDLLQPLARCRGKGPQRPAPLIWIRQTVRGGRGWLRITGLPNLVKLALKVCEEIQSESVKTEPMLRQSLTV